MSTKDDAVCPDGLAGKLGEAAQNRFVKMPETQSGDPKFSSRSDGVEAGVVNDGFVPRNQG